MNLPPNSISKGVTFWGCPSSHSYIRPVRYCYMNALNDFDKTDGIFTGDLIRSGG